MAVIRATALYFGVVFAAAFALGVLRMLVLAPALGPLMAVALELPVVLALSWLVAGRVLRLWPMALRGRLAMGTLAFALLMVAETGLALAFGQTLRGFLAAMATPEGRLGLAGQIGFAILPALRGQPRG